VDKIAFGIVGSGWRAEFYLRIAAACPDRFDVVGVVARRKERGAELERAFGVRTFRSLDAMLEATSPTFVVTSVSWPANPVFVRDLVAKGVPVLSETPPAPDLDGMQSLYADVQAGGGVVQVAEQFHLQPHHAARLAFASGGKIGRVSQAQVSVSHGYHGVSLMRRLLGIGYENATIRARSFEEPGIAGASRDAPPTEEKVSTSRQQIAWCDFGDRLGVFDFTSDQYFSYIRGQRLLVRGERGEIIDHAAVWLSDPASPVRVQFTRHDAGANGNLEGYYHKGIQAGDEWLYTNPLAPGRLSDEEIAIGSCLLRMDVCARTGEEFYPLAEACQDHYLSLMIAQAISTGDAVTTETQPWADA
jgi:hypothetical protein